MGREGFAQGLLAALLITVSSPALAASALTPQPKVATWSEGSLALDGAFVTAWNGCRDARLDHAVARFQTDVGRLTGLELRGRPGPRLAIACGKYPTAEGYRLTVTTTGVTLDADGPTGVLRGLATLRQLVEVAGPRAGLPLTRIDDAPRFAWRGLMIDTVRHFMTLETIKRQVDAMERVKLNVLHLHLSDNEGFRVESKRYPKLQATGDGQFYTQAQVRELVAYAADRGVRIVPEFDVPGHTRAWAEAYPQLGLAPLKPANAISAALDRALDPTKPETYRFIDGLFGEMAGLFPDAYFHAGGDEVSDAVWLDHPHVQAFMKANGIASKAALEAHFQGRVREILKTHGKTMIGWEEVAANGAPSDVVIQAWQTSNATADAVAKGHRTIVSAGYYLDLLMPAEFSYTKDPLDTSAAGFTPAEAEAGRKLNPILAKILTDALVAKPLPPLTPEQEALILGGEAPLWAELVSDEIIDSRLWPRAAAMAERFWSPRETRDVADLYRRLPVVEDQLRLQGLKGDNAAMAGRLAPGQAGPVRTLLEVVGPVRNMAHDHRIKAMLAGKVIDQPLTGLADAAPVDGLVARRFEADAKAYAAGDRSGAESLKARLVAWRANDAAFRAVAKGRGELEAALPISADIAELADVALAAIAAREAGQALDPAVKARAEAVLARAEAFEVASAKPLFAFMGKQPPADLIIKITPGVRALVGP